jgi:hypothetical protein
MSVANDAGRAPTEEELARAFQDLKNVHAIDVVNELLVSLYSFASTKLGLSDATAELRDLGDAHFAIEAFGALLKVVDREFGEVQTQALRDTLAQLQLGYVQALDLPGERPTEPAGAESGGEPAGAESGGERMPPEAQAAPDAEGSMPAGQEPAGEPAGEEAAAEDEGPAGEEAAAEVAPEMPEPERSAAGKPPAKKAAAKKPAAKKPAARKPAAKKPPVKKPPADPAG